MEVEYRPATEADLAAEWEVFNKAQSELYREHGFARNDMPFDRFAPPHRHLLAHDESRCFVAQAGKRVIAFTAAIVRDDMCNIDGTVQSLKDTNQISTGPTFPQLVDLTLAKKVVKQLGAVKTFPY